MKKIIAGLAMAVALCGMLGCEDDTQEKAKQLKFENRSVFAVAVISLTTEWGGFMLPPGATVKLDNIKNVDWIYEPEDKVQEGSSSKERHVIFVNAPPAKTE